MFDKKYRVLVVDDEPRYARAIQVALEISGYEVVSAKDGQKAVALAMADEFDLILLDIRLPGLDGFEICHSIREFSDVPIIMLTAYTEIADKVKGLDIGADDYVTKPFSVDEILARVRAVLRRKGQKVVAQQSELRVGQLHIDFSRRRVTLADQEVAMTQTEYRLLCELVWHAGQVIVPDHLLEQVWGERDADRYHLVWQVIYRLRRKLEEDPKNPRYIRTVPGAGYEFVISD